MNEKKTDKQIEEECKLALNQVIKSHKGIAMLKIRPHLRKAFPFGPQATEKERRIWEDMVRKATSELERWTQQLAIAALGFVLLTPGVRAADPIASATHTVNAVNVQIVTPDGKIDKSRMVTVPPRVEITDSTGTHVYMLQKPPLKQRIQQSAKRTAKKVRLSCHFMAPIVSFVGSVSQTVMAFKTH
ncbi:MAG: hypothetical protein KGI50_06220 [Patescibacteria group bacterium]|nr:hypothetical protein [Patescibacteria group bacterium]